MTAVIAPGPIGLAPPPAHAPLGGSTSPPGEAFAGVVAAALAVARAEAEPHGPPGLPRLIGTAEGDHATGEMGHPGSAELALVLAGLLPGIQQATGSDGPAEGRRSPDRIAEADLDLALGEMAGGEHDVLDALLAQVLGALTPEDGPGMTGPSVEGVTERTEALAARLAGLFGVSTPADAGGDVDEAAAWRSEVRDLLVALAERLRAHADASSGGAVGRSDVVPAQATALATGAHDGDASEPDALLQGVAAGRGAAGEAGGDARNGQDAARDGMRDAARLLESLLRGDASADGRAEAGDDIETFDLAALRQATAIAERTEALGRPGVAPGESAAESPAESEVLTAAQPLMATSAASRADAAQAAARVTDPALLAARFAETVESAVMRGTSEVRLALNPPDLGHLDITVVETEQGLRIRLEASQGATRDLMERQLPALHQALEARDLRVDRLQVSQVAPGTPAETADGRMAGESQTGGDGGNGGSDETEWSPLAALGLSEGERNGSTSASDGSGRATGVVDADGRVDVLA